MATVVFNQGWSLAPQPVSYEYTFNSRYDSHRAYLKLDADGTYTMKVDGQSYSPYEASAKRSPNYKIGLAQLASQMMHRIENYNATFSSLYKQTVHLAIASYKEREMAANLSKTDAEIETEADTQVKKPDFSTIVLKKYNKKPYKGIAPTKQSAEAILNEEADHKFFALLRSRSTEKKQYVEENLNDVYQDRIEKFRELQSFFDKIQDTLAATADAKHIADYNSKRNAMLAEYKSRRDAFIYDRTEHRDKDKNYIIGPFDYVDKSIMDLKTKVHFPFEVTVKTSYSKLESLLDVKAFIPDYIPIPETKASILSSGKISVKTKLQREKSQDLVLCQLGVAYYLCGFLFNISANIKTIRFSLLTKSNNDGLYWVQFPREQFFTLDFANIDPLITLERFPHVIKYGRVELERMEKKELDRKINDALLMAGQASNANQTVLSMTDAQHILDAMPNADDLRKAVDDATAKGQSVVVADKKYENILKEL
jgi:hypothetical protein